jgi:hypothetical protein
MNVVGWVSAARAPVVVCGLHSARNPTAAVRRVTFVGLRAEQKLRQEIVQRGRANPTYDCADEVIE